MGTHVETVKIGKRQRSLSFDSTKRFIADVKLLLLRGLSNASQYSGYGLSEDGRWITWNGDILLWLPVDYRPIQDTTNGLTVVLNSASGRMTIFRFHITHHYLKPIKHEANIGV